MVRITKCWFALSILCCSFLDVRANNIQIANVRLIEDRPDVKKVSIEFDLKWENSWRTSFGTNNWDAAWLFVKFRVNQGPWCHAWLNNTGHDQGSGTSAAMELGLLDDRIPFDEWTNPGMGMIVYRSGLGSGLFSVQKMQLCWNYGTQKVAAGATIDVQVFGIEMVMVPEGPFWVGDGGSDGTFRVASGITPFSISASGSVMKCEATNHDDGEITSLGIWVDGNKGISLSGSASESDMNPHFPTGFKGFYCMKYEISLGQYRDFLNTLTREEQNARTAANISGSTIRKSFVMTNTERMEWRNAIRCNVNVSDNDPLEFYCDYDQDGIMNEPNDGEWIACNFLSWADGAAFLDWSGLRPMTELEFEKSCRGPNLPIFSEYAWGTTSFANAQYFFDNQGSNNEGVMENYSTTAGNAAIGNTVSGSIAPLRVGIFSAHPLNTGRISAGAGFYGAMELSGNLYERSVTVGNLAGRSFTGLHGDGVLSNGNADVPDWPTVDGYGAGFRGGAWVHQNSPELMVSDRHFAAYTANHRSFDYGFRGCRSLPLK